MDLPQAKAPHPFSSPETADHSASSPASYRPLPTQPCKYNYESLIMNYENDGSGFFI
jgi:hypothetical protein